MYLKFFFGISLILSLIANCNAKDPLAHLEIIRAQRKMVDVFVQPDENVGKGMHIHKVERLRKIERPEKVEKVEVERSKKVEKVEVERPEKVEKVEVERSEKD